MGSIKKPHCLTIGGRKASPKCSVFLFSRVFDTMTSSTASLCIAQLPQHLLGSSLERACIFQFQLLAALL